MDFIKGLVIDAMNGFSPKHLAFFLLQLLCAGLFAHLFQRIYKRKFKTSDIAYLGLIAMTIALLVTLSKNSLVIAVMASAIMLLFLRLRDMGRAETIALVITALIGLGCGAGSIVQTFIGFVLLCTVILFMPLKEN